MCTVFSVYDMKKDFLIRYPGLARNSSAEKSSKKDSDEGDVSIPFWYLSSTESLSSKLASFLSKEVLERLQ